MLMVKLNFDFIGGSIDREPLISANVLSWSFAAVGAGVVIGGKNPSATLCTVFCP